MAGTPKYYTLPNPVKGEQFASALPELQAVAQKHGFQLTLVDDSKGTWYYHPALPPADQPEPPPVSRLKAIQFGTVLWSRNLHGKPRVELTPELTGLADQGAQSADSAVQGYYDIVLEDAAGHEVDRDIGIL